MGEGRSTSVESLRQNGIIDINYKNERASIYYDEDTNEVIGAIREPILDDMVNRIYAFPTVDISEVTDDMITKYKKAFKKAVDKIK